MMMDEYRRRLEEQLNNGWPPDFAFTPRDIELLIEYVEGYERRLFNWKEEIEGQLSAIREAADGLDKLVEQEPSPDLTQPGIRHIRNRTS